MRIVQGGKIVSNGRMMGVIANAPRLPGSPWNTTTAHAWVVMPGETAMIIDTSWDGRWGNTRVLGPAVILQRSQGNEWDLSSYIILQ